jgi:C2H2 transcription facotor
MFCKHPFPIALMIYRKHTGERPFQCHCSRRFSRLDNLRQHAQTVHVNEDIPGDSLAATGTRFQRQIRTDRVRPPNRSRANTLGSQGGHSRGHSRNLSTSSIASTASSISQISTRDDPRRRPPPPLAMAHDPARALSIDINPSLMGGPGPTVQTYGTHSPGDVSTPTSATYSGTGSPRFTSGLQSPTTSTARVSWAGSRTPGRRLSVPSGANPFQGPPNGAPGPPPYISPLPSGTNSTSFVSQSSSVLASPTSSQFSESRRGSEVMDADWRRRTWHPSTYTGLVPRPATSGLTIYQTPEAPRPLFATQPAASQTTRLPGIESFDHAPPPLPRRQPSPMQVDAPSRPPAPPSTHYEPTIPRPEDRRNHYSWDLSIQRGINRLDLTSPTPPRESLHGWPENTSTNAPSNTARPTTAPHSNFYPPHTSAAPPLPAQASVTNQERDAKTDEPPATPKRNKRQAWYNGPLTQAQGQPVMHSQQSSQSSFRTHRTSPEDSGSSDGVPTPSTSSVGDYHPSIMHSNGYIESHPLGAPVEDQKAGIAPPLPPYAPNRPRMHGQSHSYSSSQPSLSSSFSRHPDAENGHLPGPAGLGISAPRMEPPNDMRRLNALVAVATGEQESGGSRY